MKRFFAVLPAIFLAIHCLIAQSVTSPEAFFGFPPGSDYQIAGWEKIVAYFRLLDSESDRIQVEEPGKSTNGNPFLLAIITSEENMLHLEDYRVFSRRIASGKGFSANTLREEAAKGKIIVLITCSIHATELGATQAAPELAYQLITEQDVRAKKILDNVIFLLLPSFNPDGLILVKDWYDTYRGTPYEGSSMPWLYHPYVGHDNNRDAFMLTQVESQLVTKILYEDWFPQVYLDMHQMGNRSARMFLPPFADPVNPNIEPLIVKENSLVGEYLSTSLQAKGLKGVITRSRFTHWWQGGFLRTAWFHNIVGLLSEVASARLASPIFQKKSELRLDVPTANEKGGTVGFPDPWPGGWWRLRNIVDYDMEAAFALLYFSALHRQEMIQNQYQMARRAIARGKKEPPYAYVVSGEQWDPNAAYHLLEVLQKLGIEIFRSDSAFTADGREFPPGSFVILMAQPYRACIKDLLGPQHYPDIRAYKNGPPIPPYDNAGWTLPYQMGVEVHEIIHPFVTRFHRVKQVAPVERPSPAKAVHGLLLDARITDSFKAVNRALQKGIPVFRGKTAQQINGRTYPPGYFVFSVNNKNQHVVQQIAGDLHLRLVPLKKEVDQVFPLQPKRLGVYQPWTASIAEGWSRWVLEQFQFPYTTLHNAEIRSDDLKARFDVIYLPNIRAQTIFAGRAEGTTPPQYAGGIGSRGVGNLRKFVEEGGILIAMDAATELLVGELGLPVKNIVKGLKTGEFFCPGSILRIQVNSKHPVGYGMKSETMAFFSRSRVFQLLPSFNIQATVVAKYPASHLLKSGYLHGEEKIANGAAIVDVPLGSGHVILIGFDALHRGQAHNTFKLFFNAIFYP